MTKPSTLCWWACVGACLVACDAADVATQTIVFIDAEPAVRSATAQLSVELRSLSGEQHDTLTPEPKWPLKFVFAPEHDDASRRFAIEVSALDQEREPVVAFSIATGFRHHAAAYAKLVVHDSCVDAADACTSLECNAKSVEGNGLGRSRDDALVVDVDCISHGSDAGSGGDGPYAAGAGGESPVRNEMGGGAASAGVPGTQTGGSAGTGGAGGPAGGKAGQGQATAGSGTAGSGTGQPGSDECDPNPCGHGRCITEPRGHSCSCDAGYHDDAGRCISNDPCATDNGGCSDICTRANGRAECACPTGAWLKSDSKNCGRLGAATTLSTQASLVRAQPQLTFDAEGRAWAVWIQAAEDGLALWGAHAEPGKDFLPAAKLPITKIAPVRAPRLVVSPDAAVGLVLWLQPSSDQTGLELWSSDVQNGMWAEPTRIDGHFGAVSDPVLALDKNGAAAAAWMESQGGRYQVWMSQWSPTKREWGDASRVAGTDTVDALWPRLSLDEQGGGALVWTQTQVVNGASDPSTASLWEAHLDLASDADPKALLLAATSGQADVAIKPDGSGLLVFLGFADEAFAVLANGYRPGLGLEPSTRRNLVLPVQPAMNTQRLPYAPRVKLNAHGDGVAMWVEYLDSTSTVWGATYDASVGAWAMSQRLSPQTSVAPGWTDSVVESGLSLALDPQGNGVTVWSDYATDFRREVWLRPVRATTGFLERVRVVADSVPKQSSRVEAAVDSAGHGFLIWDVQIDSRYEVRASRLE